jgi:hypothetical protein
VIGCPTARCAEPLPDIEIPDQLWVLHQPNNRPVVIIRANSFGPEYVEVYSLSRRPGALKGEDPRENKPRGCRRKLVIRSISEKQKPRRKTTD